MKTRQFPGMAVAKSPADGFTCGAARAYKVLFAPRADGWLTHAIGRIILEGNA
jgi:hypothetical protein